MRILPPQCWWMFSFTLALKIKVNEEDFSSSVIQEQRLCRLREVFGSQQSQAASTEPSVPVPSTHISPPQPPSYLPEWQSNFCRACCLHVTTLGVGPLGS